MKTIISAVLLFTSLLGFSQSDYVKIFEARQFRDRLGNPELGVSDVKLMTLKTPEFGKPQQGLKMLEDIQFTPVTYSSVKVARRIESSMFSQYSCRRKYESRYLVQDVIMCEIINRLIKEIVR